MPGSHGSTQRAPVVRPVLRVVGVLLSAALLVASGYFWLTYRSIDHGLTRLGGLKVGEHPTNEPQVDRRAQNLLIAGNDDRSTLSRRDQEELHVGPGQGSRATDTMMIVHIPADGSRATLISLPRDSYVRIPGHGRDKLNAAFVAGYDDATGDRTAKITAGANLLIATVQNLTGLTIDRYAQIGLLGFARIANALDGVPVTLCADVDDPKSGFHAKKGRQTLDGLRALQFVRQRYNFPDGRGDLDRVKRQQYFLTAAFRRVASVGILTELQSLGDALKQSLFLDGHFKIFDLAEQVQNLTANNIRGVTIPTEFATIDGQDVLRVDPAEVKTFVSAQLNPTTAPTPTTSTPTTSTTAPTRTTQPTTAAPTTTAPAPDTRCTY